MSQEVYSCVLVDDDAASLHLMEEAFKASSLFCVVKTFSSIGKALDYVKKNDVALMVTDIEFPGEGIGYEILLRSRLPDTLWIVFISAYRWHFFSGCFSMQLVSHVIGMHPKPFTSEMVHWIEESFLKAQANESVKLPEPESFFCYEEGHKDRQRMVSYSDIVMIRLKNAPGYRGKALCIYLNTTPREHYRFSLTLQECFELLEKACPGRFLLIKRQGIVNKKNVVVKGDWLIPAHQKYSNKNLYLPIPVVMKKEINKIIPEWSGER